MIAAWLAIAALAGVPDVVVITDGQVKYLGGVRTAYQSHVSDKVSGGVAVRPIALDLFGFTLRRELERALVRPEAELIYVDTGDLLDLACASELALVDADLARSPRAPDLIAWGNHDSLYAGNIRHSWHAATGAFFRFRNFNVAVWGPSCGEVPVAARKRDRVLAARHATQDKRSLNLWLEAYADARDLPDPVTRERGNEEGRGAAAIRRRLFGGYAFTVWERDGQCLATVDTTDQLGGLSLPGLFGRITAQQRQELLRATAGCAAITVLGHYDEPNVRGLAKLFRTVDANEPRVVRYVAGHTHIPDVQAVSRPIAPSILDAYVVDEDGRAVVYPPGALVLPAGGGDPVVVSASAIGDDAIRARVEARRGSLAAYADAIESPRSLRRRMGSTRAAVALYFRNGWISASDARPIMIHQMEQAIELTGELAELSRSPEDQSWLAAWADVGATRAAAWRTASGVDDMDLFHFGCALPTGFEPDCMLALQHRLRRLEHEDPAYAYMHDLALEAALEEQERLVIQAGGAPARRAAW